MRAPVAPPALSGFTSTTEQPLYWCAYGDAGAPPLLVLHGGPGAHHDYLLPQFLRLSASHRIFLFDQRGGGRSKTNEGAPITWRTHVADLGRLVAELPVRPLTLVGYSWGGLLALLYALDARRGGDLSLPERLVLVDPAPIARRFREAFESEFQRRQAAPEVAVLRSELAASGLRETDPPRYRQRLFELGVAGYFADPAHARDLTPFRITGKVQQSVWDSLGDYDLSDSLAELRVPTLVVHGRHDPIPLESSARAARALNARFLVLEASGHVPYVEQPEALFSTIAQFLHDTA